MNKTLKTTIQTVENLSQRALRSRDKLKHSVKILLNDIGFMKLRVQDVTEKAGVAAGLFYRYFVNMEDIVYEVSKDFMEDLNEQTQELPDTLHPYDQIFQFHAIAANCFAENPGIMRCLFQLDGDYPQFREIWKRAAHDWNLQVARFIRRSVGGSKDNTEHMAFVLGAMTEGVFFQYFIRHSEDISAMGKSPNDIAEIISVMWYRSIFFANPPRGKLKSAQSLTSIKAKSSK